MMLPEELKNCSNMEDDADRIMAWAWAAMDPIYLMWHLPSKVIDNFDNIVAKVSLIISYIGYENWNNAGKTYAQLLIFALGPFPAKVDSNKEAALKLIKQRNTDRRKEAAH